MKFSLFLNVTVVVLLNCYLSASGSANGPNAAVKYLRADASLRQAYPLPPNATLFLEAAVRAPLSVDDEKLVAAAADALAEFEHGSEISRCEWNMSIEDGPSADTSHRGAIRELVSVALLRTRLRVRDGHFAEAVQDLLSSYVAARHLSFDGSIASVLFGFAVEREINGVLLENLAKLDSSSLRKLEVGLGRLPTSSRIRTAIVSEKLERNDLGRVIQRATNRAELIEALLGGVPLMKGDRKVAAELVDSCKGTTAGMKHCVEEQINFVKRWADRFDEEPDQFQKDYERAYEEAAKNNGVISFFTPSLSRFRWAEEYSDTRRELVKAAVAIQSRGPNESEKFREPLNGKPFRYVASGGAFRLNRKFRKMANRCP